MFRRAGRPFQGFFFLGRENEQLKDAFFVRVNF